MSADSKIQTARKLLIQLKHLVEDEFSDVIECDYSRDMLLLKVKDRGDSGGSFRGDY